ncbi:MAG: hypothetical protein JNL61_05880 [Rhizobiaceae bacterium]|nr:hypothetical protein [Rhizobiaceae bacterium]
MRMVLIVGALAIAGPVQASGGLNCEAKDKAAELSISSGITRGMGSPLFNFNGDVRVAGKKVAADLARTTFGDDHVAQYWLDGEDLRLVLYRERDAGKPHGYVEVTILANAAGEENTFAGDYAITIYDGVDGTSEGRTVNLGGRVDCFVE